MALSSWLRRTKDRLERARPARGAKARRPACRPAVEVMEDRITPASRLFAVPIATAAGAGQIVELNPTTGAVVATLPAPQPATLTGEVGLAFDGSRLFYLNGGTDDRLYELNPDTGAVVDSAPVVGGSGGYDGLAVVAGQVYIQDYANNQILVFDPASDTVVRTLTVAADLLGGLAGASNPGALIAPINGGNLIAEIDPATGAVTHTFQPGFPNLLGAAVVGSDIYLGSGTSNAVFRYTRTGTFLGQLSIPFPVGALASDDTTGAPAPQVVNGGFELGTTSGWTVFNAPGSAGTGFQAYTGSNPQQSTLSAPPEGTYAAYNNHNGPGTYILYQDITVPAGATQTLSLTADYQNQFAQGFITPATLDYRTGPNQQFRIDVVSPTGDLLSTDSSVVKLNLFRTAVGDPLSRSPFTVTGDLTPFAGQTVRLRIAVANNQFFLFAGVDDVRVTAGTQTPVGTVTGVKFNDLNGDGVKGPGEAGLPGWTVYADLNNNRRLDPGEPSTTTAADGSYTLTVAPGTYTFREVPQAGWVQTAPAYDQLFAVRAGAAGAPQTIAEYDAAGTVLHSFPGPANVTTQGPQGLASAGDGLFYIDGTQASGTGTHTLYELDPATGAVLDSDTLPATQEIAGLAYLNGLVYVQVHQPNQLLVFDPVSDTVLRTLTLAADVRGGMTGAAELGLLFASGDSGQVFAINPQTGAVVRTLTPNVGPLVGGLGYYHGELVAANFGPTVFRINPQTGAVLGTITLGGLGGGIAGLAGDGRVGGGRRLTLTANQSVSLDLGNRRDEGTVSGVKFNDANGNGARDAGEAGLPGWTIYADLNNNHRLDPGEPSTTTDATGAYTLTVPSGVQSIREVAQAGWVQTAPLAYTLYATGANATQLLTVDPATGTATPAGAFGFPQTASVAVGPDGTLWTIVNAFDPSQARLARVDPANGLATPVGNPNWTGSPMIALEADPAGTLYAVNYNGQLDRLDRTTGAATLVGTLGFQTAQDLAFDPAGGLWALDGSNRLFRVDPATGAAAFVANVTGTAGTAVALMIHPGTGTFYVTSAGSVLYTLNPATGQTTFVGPYSRASATPGGDFAVDNGHTVVVTPGSSAAGRDFANRRDEGTVTGVKFDDANGNGVRDPGEAGLPGWTIYADVNSNGKLDAGEPSAVTAGDGSYSLTLGSGSYALREVSQAGWVQTGPAGDRLFALRATSTQTLNVVELDTFGFVVNTFPAPAPVASFGLQGLAVGHDSLFYIDGSLAGTGTRTLYELDPATGAVTDTTPLALPGGAVSGLAYLDGLVYVLNSSTNQIVAVNPVTDAVVRTLTPQFGGLFGGLTGAADLGLLFATSGGVIVALDPVTGAVVRTLPAPTALAGGLAYRNGELLGVALTSTSAPIFRIDPLTGAVRGTLAPSTPNTTGLGGDGAPSGPRRVTVTPGAVLTGRDFGNQRVAPPAAADDAATVGEDGTLTVPARGVLANDAGVYGARAVVAVNGTRPVGQTILLPSGSLLRVNSDGGYVYTPGSAFQALPAGATATDSFTYTMADGLAATATATVRVTIVGANDAPVARPDAVSTDEDTAVAGNVLANDSDVDTGDTRSVTAVNGDPTAVGQPITLPSGARLTLRADGTFDYDPSGAFDRLLPGQTAQDQFTYTVADAAGAASQAAVTVLVAGVNDGPTAADDAGETDEDTPLSAAAPGVLGNDTDPDAGDTRTVTAVNGSAAAVGQPVTLPSGATITLRADGSYTYDPRGAWDFLRPGDTATDAVAYTMADAAGAPSSATLVVTVNGLNDPPVAADDATTTDEDTALTAAPSLLANDSDPDHHTVLSVAAVNGDPAAVGQPVALASGAVLTVLADGSYRYDPNGAFEALGPGQTATDSFTYSVSDGTVSSTAAVTITVTGVNDAPVAADVNLAVGEDGPAAGSAFAATDAEPGALLFTVLTPPAGGRVTNNGDGTFSFNPGPDFQDLPAGGQRTVTFTYEAEDADGGVSAPATVTVVVTGANDDPVAVNDAGTTNEDTALVAAAPGVLGNDTDVDAGDTRTVAAVNGDPAAVGQPVTLASGAVLTVLADGRYTYDPHGAFEALGPGQTATDSFTYAVADALGATSVATVTVTVTGVNDAPVARPDAYATDEDTELVAVLTNGILVNDSDVDGGTLTAAVATGPGHGTVAVRPDGTFTYRPAANFNGTDSFTYTVSDGQGGSATGTVTITVNPVNDPPTLAPATFTLPENTPAGTVVGTVTGADVDGDPLRYRITGGNTGGAFAIDPATGRITVANAAVLDYETTPVFTLTVEVSDPAGLTATATVTVRLSDVITPPQIDVLPGDARNRINSRSGGKIAVAILSNAEFDARLIDVTSIRFGRTGQEDSVSQQPNRVPRYKLEDVNGDGRLDLVVEVEVERTGFRPGDAKGILTGKLRTGFAFAAEDAVTVV